MPTLSNRPQKIVGAAVELGPDYIVNVRFNASALTPAWVRDTQRRADDSDPLSMAKAVADILVEWDVTNDDGSPYPPTADNLAVFSFVELGAFVERMIEAATPASAEGNASGNISATPAQDFTSLPATPQNGHTPSVSQSPSESVSLT